MAWGGFILTNAGRNLLAKIQAGTIAGLNITRFGIGDGTYTGSFTTIANLVSQKQSVPLRTKNAKDQFTNIDGYFSNEGLSTGFYFREWGIFAMDGLQEVLYAYDNAGTDAEYIVPDGNIKYEKMLKAALAISTDINVTINTEGVILASKEDVDDIAGEGRTTETVKGNADNISGLAISKSDKQRPITAKTASYTVVAADLDTNITVTEDTTITLTNIVTLGLGFRCRVSNIGTGIITVVPTGTDTIAKGTSITIYPGKCVEVVADYVGMWTVVGFDFTEQINHLEAYAIASGTNTYVANITGITTLKEGFTLRIKFTNANTNASTLNVNGLGAKSILKGNGSILSSGNIKAGQICNLVYGGSNFQLLGEGGEYGTATASDVLSGKTVGTDNGVIEGTIPSKGASTITPSTVAQIISAGQYLSGIQTISGDADLISANIKSGKNIFGVAGNSNVVDTSAGTAYASRILSAYKAYVDGALIVGTMPDRGTVNNTLTTQGQQYTIPNGYHSGSGKVTASFSNLSEENIKSGVNIGGVIGSYKGIKRAFVTEGKTSIPLSPSCIVANSVAFIFLKQDVRQDYANTILSLSSSAITISGTDYQSAILQVVFIEFETGIVKSIQTKQVSTSGNHTINSVDTNKTVVLPMSTFSKYEEPYLPYGYLTSSTNVFISNYNNLDVNMKMCIVEFY